MKIPYRQIRADFDADSIVVYQAYNAAIADKALVAQAFVAPFSYSRMTWIKPSFLWMMERSGWAGKKDQERILAVRIGRKDWETALEAAVVTSPGSQDADSWRDQLKNSPIRLQWDPERSLRGGKLEYRSIQIGIARTWSERYATEWVREIRDLTRLTRRIAGLRAEGNWDQAKRLLPPERVYPLPVALAERLRIG